MAQQYFNQGVRLLYAFNFPQAMASFSAAQNHGHVVEGDVALCWWGEAFAAGQNLNAGMKAERLPQAVEALRPAVLYLSPSDRAAISSYRSNALFQPQPVGTGWGLPTTQDTTAGVTALQPEWGRTVIHDALPLSGGKASQLIGALQRRYVSDANVYQQRRHSLNVAYADAMRNVSRAFPVST